MYSRPPASPKRKAPSSITQTWLSRFAGRSDRPTGSGRTARSRWISLADEDLRTDPPSGRNWGRKCRSFKLLRKHWVTRGCGFGNEGYPRFKVAKGAPKRLGHFKLKLPRGIGMG